MQRKMRPKQTDNFFSPLIENKHGACKLRRLRKPGAAGPGSGRRMRYSGALQGQSADWLIIIKAARLHWDSCLHCAAFYGHTAGEGWKVLFLTVCGDSVMSYVSGFSSCGKLVKALSSMFHCETLSWPLCYCFFCKCHLAQI